MMWGGGFVEEEEEEDEDEDEGSAGQPVDR